MDEPEKDAPKKQTKWEKYKGSEILIAVITAAVMLIGSNYFQKDIRLKDSLEKQIVYAERMSADLSNEFATFTLKITETQGIPAEEKQKIIEKLTDLYQAIDRVETRVAGPSEELTAYRNAISRLRVSLLAANTFMQYKQVLEAMGSVKVAEKDAFIWLALEAGLKESG